MSIYMYLLVTHHIKSGKKTRTKIGIGTDVHNFRLYSNYDKVFYLSFTQLCTNVQIKYN